MSNLRQMCPHATCAIWPRPIDSLLSPRATGSQVSLMDNSHMLKNDNFITMSVISPPQLILPALQHDSVTGSAHPVRIRILYYQELVLLAGFSVT